MKNKNESTIKRFFALTLCTLTLLTCFSSCAGNAVTVTSLSSAEKSAVSADLNTALSVAPAVSAMKKISSSGMAELFFDEKTFSVSIHNTQTDKLWSSLPTAFNNNSQTVPSVLSLDVLVGNTVYTLNSQQHSVAQGKAEYAVTDGIVDVKYNFSFSVDENEVFVSVPLRYELKDGSLFASINCAEITTDGQKDLTVMNLRLLNYFGANTACADADYMLVPDGCGAIIYPAKLSGEFKPVSIKTYGVDPAVSDIAANTGVVGAYGFKQGNNAVVTVIEDGEALSVITADVAANCGYNRVGAEFEITASKLSEKNNKLNHSAESYDGTIKLCFRFLASGNANYTAMASACREQLIRSGMLSSKTLEEDNVLPVLVTLDGAEKTGSISGTTALTSFEQAQDLLTLLKAKGFSNIFTRYRGIFGGAVNQSQISNLTPIKALGGLNEFNLLTDYMNAQQLEIYPDINIISAAKGNLSNGNTATSLSRSDLSHNLMTNALTTGKQIIYPRTLLRLNKLESAVIDILTNTKELNITGYCIDDAGEILYSDYSSNSNFNRQKASDHIASQSEALVTGKKLMVNNGNMYMLKNATIVSNIPFSTAYETGNAYVAVPFVQMILHGMMYYSGEPLNLTDNPEMSLLKCIEYGAIPSFEWYYNSIEFKQESNEKSVTANNYCYTNWTNVAYTLYEKANEALADTSSSRITAHYLVQPNVYCTEYDDTMVYVNYGDTPVIINGMTVEAKNFLRIN